ncbi:MAG: hypothetical protein ACR2NN_07375 [Bryobacteraceae bacterium]
MTYFSDLNQRSVPSVAGCAAVLGIFLWCPTALPQNCSAHCAPNPDGAIVVDGQTGDRVDGGATHFRKKDRVRVVFTNINPYACDAKTEVKGQEVAEPGLSAFLGLLGGPLLPKDDKKSTEKVDLTHTADFIIATEKPVGCAGEQSAGYQALVQRDKLLFTQRGTTRAAYNDLAVQYSTTTDKYNQDEPLLKNKKIVCPRLCEIGDQLLNFIIEFEKKDTALQSALVSLRDLTEQQAVAIQAYQWTCEREHTHMLEELEAARSAYATYTKSLQDVAKDKKKLEDIGTAIRAVQEQPHAFWQERSFGPADVPTDFQIKFSCGDKQVGETIKINLGGDARFVVAGGIAVTALQKVDYQRVQGFAAPGDTTLSSLVGEKERSSSRVTPMAMLHGRMFDWHDGNNGLYLSLGVTAKNDNKGTDIDYLMGPSIGLLGQKLFLTGGAYVGKKQSLEGGLYRGATIPKDLAEIPVRKDFHWSGGFAITYVIKKF